MDGKDNNDKEEEGEANHDNSRAVTNDGIARQPDTFNKGNEELQSTPRYSNPCHAGGDGCNDHAAGNG